MEIQQDTVVDTSGASAPAAEAPAPAAADPAVAAPAAKAPAEQTVAEKLDNLRVARDAKDAKADPAAPAAAIDPANPAASAPGVFAPNYKYKVMDKEHEIPKEFQGLIKDADTEKKVREIFERSTGLDVVKENLSTARTERDQARTQYQELNGHVNDLRGIYQTAAKTGDWHKLDRFWQKLEIPQDVIMEYALAKVKLNEMDPAQRSAIEARQRAEYESEDVRRQQAQIARGYVTQAQQVKGLLLDSALNRPENQAAASDFDARVGKPGMFLAEVRRWGETEWHRSGGKVDLSPDQAIAAVIQHYGLSTVAKPAAPAAAPAAPAALPKDPKQNVIVKPVATIPNMGGGGSTSPLKSKPRSIEDLNALRKRAEAGEAI